MTGNENILTIENSFYAAKIEDKLIEYDPEVMGSLAKSILEGMQLFLAGHGRKI